MTPEGTPGCSHDSSAKCGKEGMQVPFSRRPGRGTGCRGTSQPGRRAVQADEGSSGAPPSEPPLQLRRLRPHGVWVEMALVRSGHETHNDPGRKSSFWATVCPLGTSHHRSRRHSWGQPGAAPRREALTGGPARPTPASSGMCVPTSRRQKCAATQLPATGCYRKQAP